MKRWQIAFGLMLIALGFFALLEAILNIDLWRFTGPLIMIGLGLLLILRPRIAGPDVQVQMAFFGENRKFGVWEATQHEFWWFVGSSHWDFTGAVFPEDDASIKIFGFVSDLKIILPEDVGLRVSSTAFVSEFIGSEGKDERFLSPLNYQSPNYLEVQKRVIVETVSFVSEIKVQKPLM